MHLTIEYLKLEGPIADGDDPPIAYRLTIDGRRAVYLKRRDVDVALATAFLRVDAVSTQAGHTRAARRAAV